MVGATADEEGSPGLPDVAGTAPVRTGETPNAANPAFGTLWTAEDSADRAGANAAATCSLALALSLLTAGPPESALGPFETTGGSAGLADADVASPDLDPSH